MKVRIGVSLGPAAGPDQFAAAVDLLEQEGVDSLWLPENVYSPSVEPFTGMAFALSRTRRLKAGSGISVLPGRHPVLVAKQLASLAGLAPARVLPVFGLQPAQPAERPLFPAPPHRRAAVFDESLTLLRLLLTQPTVTFHGEFFTVDGALHSNAASSQTPWIGAGSWVLAGKEAAKSTIKAENVPVGIDNSGDAPPRLTRGGTASRENPPSSAPPAPTPPSTVPSPTTPPSTTAPAPGSKPSQPDNPASSPAKPANVEIWRNRVFIQNINNFTQEKVPLPNGKKVAPDAH